MCVCVCTRTRARMSVCGCVCMCGKASAVPVATLIPGMECSKWFQTLRHHENTVGTKRRATSWVSGEGKTAAVLGEGGEGGGEGLPPRYLSNQAEFRRGSRRKRAGSAEPARRTLHA